MTASIVDIKDHGGNFGFNVFCHKEIRIYVPKKMFYLGRCLESGFTFGSIRIDMSDNTV